MAARTTLGCWCLALSLAACGGRARSHTGTNANPPPEEAPDAGGPVSCAGILGPEPTVLRADVATGQLFLGGDRLILVEDEGRVLRIERCTGDATVLASGFGRVSAAVGAGAYVWVASGTPSLTLRRVALHDGQSEVIAASPYGSLAADESDVFFLERPNGDAMVAVTLSANTAKTRERRTLEREYSLRLLAAGPAGVYFTQDCDCAPNLRRLPPGEGALVAIEGTGPSAVSSYYTSVLAHGGSLYVSLSPSWLRRLPPEGGELETLLATSGVQSLSAAGDTLCWWQGSLYGAGSVHCASLTAASFGPRELDRVETGGMRAVVVASDAVYWLRATSSDLTLPLELVAAAL